ncbi:MAG: HAD family hydrolase [Clostridiaceae bacterium]
MKTLYVSDLDGTLLNSNSIVSENSKQIINRGISKGVLFSVATARTPATVMNLLEDVNIQLPMVLMTGALTYDKHRNIYTDVRSFTRETTEAIIEILEAKGLSAFVYTVDNNHLRVFYKEATNELERNFIKEREGTPYKTFIITKSYYNISHSSETVLFFIMDDFNKVDSVREKLKNIKGINTFCYRDIFDTSKGYLEVFSQGTSKAEAITRLASAAAADRLVVFGDNLNDIPMFNIADECYATENAFPEVKAEATGIIKSNDQDGVAEFLRTKYRL